MSTEICTLGEGHSLCPWECHLSAGNFPAKTRKILSTRNSSILMMYSSVYLLFESKCHNIIRQKHNIMVVELKCHKADLGPKQAAAHTSTFGSPVPHWHAVLSDTFPAPEMARNQKSNTPYCAQDLESGRTCPLATNQ